MTKKRKLVLNRATLVELSAKRLADVHGGFAHPVVTGHASCLPDGCVSFATEAYCPTQNM